MNRSAIRVRAAQPLGIYRPLSVPSKIF